MCPDQTRLDLNKGCTILQIILKVWQYSWVYKVTFHWSTIIGLEVESLPYFIKNNSDLYQVCPYFWSLIFRDVLLLGFFFLLFSTSNSKSVIFSNLFSEQCHFCLSVQVSSQSDKCSYWIICYLSMCCIFVFPGVYLFHSYSMTIWHQLMFVLPSWRWMLHNITAFESVFSAWRNFDTVTSRWHFLIKWGYFVFFWY